MINIVEYICFLKIKLSCYVPVVCIFSNEFDPECRELNYFSDSNYVFQKFQISYEDMDFK